jgi:hypothetical protein
MEHGAERAALTTAPRVAEQSLQGDGRCVGGDRVAPRTGVRRDADVAFAEGRELPLAEASRARRAVRPR